MLLRSPALALTALVASTLVGVTLPGAALAAPVEIPTSVADPAQGQGQGLCVANAVSMQPTIDFPQQAGVFNAGMNAFFEAHKADRTEYTLRTIFDLSNNITFGTDQRSYGDFTDSMLPQCKTGGCDFLITDTTTSFGTRARGFLNVTTDLANKPVHIGFYADDAVSLIIYDKARNGYPVITQPPVLGFPSWRMTETVTFKQVGLYPIEIIHAEIGEHAALEMSFFIGDFVDFQRPYNQVPVVSLKDAGFTLFAQTNFFQTIAGTPSFSDPDKCKQCDRQFVGSTGGNNGCDLAFYCNEAALCAPCDTAYFCGPSCSPCGEMTPFCINENGTFTCVACTSDKDCKTGFSCDPILHVCNECNVDTDCAKGETCIDHRCDTCATPDQCAGNSCNCCPKGSNGKQMSCTSIEDGLPPECVECTKDADCDKGVCDVLIGQCVDALAKNEKTGCCGDNCLKCPGDNPLCLPSPYGSACAQCRQDMQCDDGSFCTGGQCATCNTDRRCGIRCGTCGGNTPYCLTAQKAADAECVRCTSDEQCGAGGKCNETTHACDNDCAMTCAPETPYCDGSTCVECYADTQCPCGGTCDPASHTCSESCKKNADCLGDQHCRYTDDGTAKECAPGALPDGADCGSTLADLCVGNSIGSRGKQPTPVDGIFALAGIGLLLRRRARARREGSGR
ncbi:MAG: outer membrane exchange protein TraA family protein [Minicystis sp.]